MRYPDVPAGAEVAPDVSIGSGALLTRLVTIEEGVRVSSGVIFAEEGNKRTYVRGGAWIGSGAVIGAGIEVGWGARVEPGSVVLASVPPNAIVRGNPARIIGYTTEPGAGPLGGADLATPVFTGDPRSLTSFRLGVGETAIYRTPLVEDLRGSLTVGEFTEGFPFVPKRYFIVFGVPSEELRGEHAHRACEQFLVCVQGSCRALLDDGMVRREIVLDRPNLGLYMPRLIWGTQYRYTRDAVLIVFASHPYDKADYIRTYEEFRREVGRSDR